MTERKTGESQSGEHGMTRQRWVIIVYLYLYFSSKKYIKKVWDIEQQTISVCIMHLLFFGG
jgi:hypothetical protein